eukprot:gnl/MRDRNA2_/MRDRNA2_122786_c0_seq1.p1 gnl/MRDRNA2_/MRDRNA2_122786_c0~~gnl/MRDRNA2_/MRDRNA2_122786_c0_seq1.p1  ORF type:complete len:453 (-),score=55.96 gnl/MRDRNA2_/MRDRNA2_122786_c0_seq1:208-1566(-)
MILYDTGSWLGAAFKWTGTVFTSIAWPAFWMILYNVGAYFLTLYLEYNLGSQGHTILGSTMSFLLIFRANQAYSRYWQGRNFVSYFFAELRDLSMLFMLYMKAGTGTVNWQHRRTVEGAAQELGNWDELDVKASDARVRLARLVIGLAVSLKLHLRLAWDGYCFGSIAAEEKFRVDWDRFRLAQLLVPEEFQMVDDILGICEDSPEADILEALARQFKENDEPPEDFPHEFKVDLSPNMRAPLVMLFFIREVIYGNMNDLTNQVPHGIKERFVPVLNACCANAQKWYELMNQVITTPLPLPYSALCRTLLAIFLLSFPFFVDYRLGWFANTIIPSLLCVALLGIDAIANELENPFGDDDNDLDILECIHHLEHEVLEYLALAGDQRALDAFQYRRLPSFIAEASCKPIKSMLVTKENMWPQEVIKGDEDYEPEKFPTTGLKIRVTSPPKFSK